MRNLSPISHTLQEEVCTVQGCPVLSRASLEPWPLKSTEGSHFKIRCITEDKAIFFYEAHNVNFQMCKVCRLQFKVAQCPLTDPSPAMCIQGVNTGSTNHESELM